MVKIVLMSIRPVFAERLLDGSKRYELRRTRVQLSAGDVVVVYASSPVCAVVGAFVVRGVELDSPSAIWRRHGGALGIERHEYCDYFEGAVQACAIAVGPRVRCEPLLLSELRAQIRGFRPPQSYMFCRDRAWSPFAEITERALASAS